MKYIPYLIIFLIFFLQSCQKEKDPAIEIRSLTTHSVLKFKAVAHIKEKGTYSISDYGFIYSIGSNKPSEISGSESKISMGTKFVTDSFVTIIYAKDYGYYGDNLNCYVRAFVTNEKGTIYSDLAQAPLIALKASAIFPSVAKAGDTIVINGKHFNSTYIKVFFNNIQAYIVSSSSTELKVIVPSNITTRSYESYINVKIVSDEQTLELNNHFTLDPSPSGLQRNHGLWSEPVYILGNGFKDITVLFENFEVPISSYGPNGPAIVYIPGNITQKSFNVYIKKPGGTKTLVPGGPYTIDKVKITSVSPQICYPGNKITLNGTSTNPVNSNNILTIGKYTLFPLNIYTPLSYSIPDFLQPGHYEAYINNSIDTAYLPQGIDVVNAKITNISDTAGYIGSSLTLTGSNIYEKPDIFFNSALSCPASYWQTTYTSSSINFNIPPVNPGKYTISARFGSSTATCPFEFRVLLPSVSSITPASGVKGDIVTITGKGLAAGGSVRFGNCSAYILSATDTQLKVLVPTIITPGEWDVFVWIGGYQLHETLAFSVPSYK